MAKFGTDVTSMSGVSGSGIFGMNVREGVVDKSAAMNVQADTAMMEAVGKTAIDAHRGYELARYEQSQDEVISDYMSRRAPNLQQMEVELAAQSKAVDAVWDNPTSTTEEMSAVESAFSEKLTKLRNAQKQGVMSPDEFNARVLQTTREAVARNPGLYNDLVEQGRKMLELSGITTIVDYDKKVAEANAKVQEEQDKQFRTTAIRLGIDPADPMMRSKVLDYNGKMAQFDLFTKADGFTDLQRKQIINDPSQLNTVFSGASFTLAALGNSLIAEETVPAQQRLLLLRTRYNDKKRELLNSFGSNAGDKVVQDNIATLDQELKMYEDVITGVLPANIAKSYNELRTQREMSRLGLPEASVYLPYWNALSEPDKIMMKKDGFFKFSETVLSGQSGKVFDWKDKSAAEGYFKFSSVALDQAKQGNPKDLAKIFESFHNTMFDATADATTRQQAASSFMRSMSANGAHESINNLPVEHRQQLLMDSKEYLGQLANSILTITKFPDNTPINKPVDLSFVMMGNSIVFSSQLDPRTASKLNSVYGQEINNTIKTMANLNGHGDVGKMLKDKESGLLDTFKVLAGQSGRVATGTIKRPAAQQGGSQFAAPSMQVTHQQQATRDNIRKQILQDELVQEESRFRSAVGEDKIISGKNIEALRKELARMQ